MFKFFFPSIDDNNKTSSILLALRVVIGLFLMYHGMEKILNFSSMEHVFPDPLGVGSEYSLMLAIFGEFFCSMAFIAGFLYMLATIPMMITMGVAYYVAHDELALLLLILLVMVYITGPGKFACDTYIAYYIKKWKK